MLLAAGADPATSEWSATTIVHAHVDNLLRCALCCGGPPFAAAPSSAVDNHGLPAAHYAMAGRPDIARHLYRATARRRSVSSHNGAPRCSSCGQATGAPRIGGAASVPASVSPAPPPSDPIAVTHPTPVAAPAAETSPEPGSEHTSATAGLGSGAAPAAEPLLGHERAAAAAEHMAEGVAVSLVPNDVAGPHPPAPAGGASSDAGADAESAPQPLRAVTDASAGPSVLKTSAEADTSTASASPAAGSEEGRPLTSPATEVGPAGAAGSQASGAAASGAADVATVSTQSPPGLAAATGPVEPLVRPDTAVAVATPPVTATAPGAIVDAAVSTAQTSTAARHASPMVAPHTNTASGVVPAAVPCDVVPASHPASGPVVVGRAAGSGSRGAFSFVCCM